MPQPNLYTITWNQRTADLANIVFDLINDQPVLLRIEGIPDAQRCAFADEMTRGGQDERSSWKAYMTDANRPTKTVGHPQLTTLLPSDAHANQVWLGLCRSLRMLPDSATGTQIVANVIRDGVIRTTNAHWHSPPVINVQVYGSASKTYKFCSFKNLTTAQQTYVNRSFVAEWTATIGRDKEANAIIFPSGMYHEISTHAGTRMTIPRKESQLDQINRYIGVAVPLKDVPEIKRLLQLKLSQVSSRQLYGLWEPVLRPYVSSGVVAAMHAATHENSDRSLYLGIGTYAIIDADTKMHDGKVVNYFEETMRILQEHEAYEAWTLQLGTTKQEGKRHSKQLHNVWRKQSSNGVDALLEQRFPQLLPPPPGDGSVVSSVAPSIALAPKALKPTTNFGASTSASVATAIEATNEPVALNASTRVKRTYHTCGATNTHKRKAKLSIGGGASQGVQLQNHCEVCNRAHASIRCKHKSCTAHVCSALCAGYHKPKYLKEAGGWTCRAHKASEDDHAWFCPMCKTMVTDRGDHVIVPSIGCDECDRWFCLNCVGLDEGARFPRTWYCAECRG